MPDSFNFDETVVQVQIPVRYQGIDYVLMKASGEAAVRYRNAIVRGTRFSADGSPIGTDGLADAEPILVAHCLFKTDKDGQVLKDRSGCPIHVTEALVRSWPNEVMRPLFDKAFEISDLTEPETEESLRKKLDTIQRKLDRFQTNGKAADEGTEKNLLEDTMVG